MNHQDPTSSERSPEVLSPAYEDGESNELNDLIRGMHELADASGRINSTQFAVDTLEQMKTCGMEINQYSMNMVLSHAFGDPGELLSRMEGRSAEELDEMLPGEIGDAAIEYLKPVLDQK